MTAACALDRDPNEQDRVGVVEQRDSWGATDSPSAFGASLVYDLASLPSSGESTLKPWVGAEWPKFQDAINYHWDGATSEAAPSKYQRAFGSTSTNVEDSVSAYHGVDAYSTLTPCVDTLQCNANIGEVCGKRAGASQGRCMMPTWTLSHAWAAASLLLPEPRGPVTLNGVTFKVQDIKALATLAYDPSVMKVVGSPCTAGSPGQPLTLDAYGRPTDPACRDTNAGAFHVAVTNRIGRDGLPLVTARSVNGIARHTPAFKYETLEQRAVSVAEAWQKMGATASGGSTINASGSVAQNAWWNQAAITVAPGTAYRVQMSGVGDADLYVQFGARPTTSSFVCRPYLGDSNEVCEGIVPAGATQLYVGVRGYTAATFSVSTTTGGTYPSTWGFQPSAASLSYVKARLYSVTPSAPEVDGNLAALLGNYTRSDDYEYILEVDATGKVVGGEWLGASKKDHPDFLWYPSGASATSVAGGAIMFAYVKDLVDLSQTVTVTASGSVAVNEWKFFGPYATRAGTNLQATMTGTGDLDLYVRSNGVPSSSSWDCRPYTSTANETCTVAGSSNTYVGIFGYTPGTYALTITYTAL